MTLQCREYAREEQERLDKERRQRIFKKRRKTMMVIVSLFCLGFIVGVLLNYV